MSLRRRYALFTLLLLVLMGSFVLLVEQQTAEAARARRHIRLDLAEVSLLLDLQESLGNIERLARGDRSSGGEQLLRAIEDATARLASLRATVVKASNAPGGGSLELEAVEEFEVLLERWRAWQRSYTPEGVPTPGDMAALDLALAGSHSVRKFALGAAEELGEALEQLNSTERRIWKVTWRWAVLMAVILLAGWIAFYRWLVLPILRFRRLVRRMRKHPFAVEIPEGEPGEVGELMDSFSDMSRKLQRFTGNLEEIVAKRTAELEASRSRLGGMLDRLPDAVGLSAADGSLVQCNARYQELLAPEGVSRFPDVTRGEMNVEGFHQWLDQAGKLHYLEARRFVLTQEGEQEGEGVSLEYFRDMTERLEIEAALATSKKLAAIGRLSSGIAHEVNNPLTAIGACAEGLLRRVEKGACDNEILADYLCTIRDEVFRCKEMTEKLLDFSRQGVEEPAAVDVLAIAEATVQLLRPLAEERGVELRCSGAGGFETLTSGRAIKQVLLNLLMNAIEASNAGGRVDVSVTTKEDTVEISVSDEGVGIPAEQLGRLFEPFFTQRRGNSGTGLGLFVCPGIAEAIGGSILATSEGENCGSQFLFSFPRRHSTGGDDSAHESAN